MENWQKVKELLDEVINLDASEREKFLINSEIDKEIREEVKSLLAYEEDSENLINLSAVGFSKGFFDDEKDTENPLTGQTIGAYKIIREIGYGGMGAVYLAERTDGKFSQRVALKLLKREMNTAALRRRFEQERNILASLEHPNIARLLNAGKTEDNIPYIAMEYVEGLPIDDYCNKNKLNLDQRLELFREVCQAVDFAHRNLIVHRDLKPSNILVTNDGKPKLLDFGISKILSDEFNQINTATITKLGVMTPSYASPEQLQSKSVTTATDIYSLGVVLFEILSGHRPFETKEENLKEIYKAVIETDPPPPSQLIDSMSKAFKELTNARTELKDEDISEHSTVVQDFENRTEPNKLRNTLPSKVNLSSGSLRGDLDNIVLKALRKEPERRYSSAENLSEDIRRHLRGLPVTARPNTISYRAEKFFKRNKASVFAGIIILLAIVGGLFAILWQSRVAQAEAAKAKRINAYLQNVLNFSNPHWLSSNPERNRNATIGEAIDKAAEKIEVELADEPEIQAEIQLTLGMTYLGQGRYDEAEKMLRSSKEKFGVILGETNTQTMKAAVILADTFLSKGKLDEAKILYDQAIEVFSNSSNLTEDEKNKWLSIAYCDLGVVYIIKDNFDLGEELTLKSLEYGDKLSGSNRAFIPIALNNLGSLYNNRGQYQKSLGFFQQSLNESNILSNEPKLEDGMIQSNIGNLYKELGDYDQATEWLDKGYKTFVKVVGEKHSQAIIPLINWADVDYLRGDYEKGLEKIAKVLDIQHELFPKGHYDISRSQFVKGKIYTKIGRLKEGEELLRKSISKNQEVSGINSLKAARGKIYLGENLIQQKRFDEAEKVLSETLELLQNINDGKHPFLNELKEVMAKLPNFPKKNDEKLSLSSI